MGKEVNKSIFARIWQWLLDIFGLSKKDEDSNTKPASNDAGQEDVDTPSTIAEKSAEEHTAPHSSNTEQTASNDDRRCDANNTNEEQVPIQEKIFKKVKLIEEYLALDKIASEAKTIDYSFVKDSIIRGKLISDHTSMWRCRLGTRTHNPEFNEFCLYVQMQVESLLRYYYSKRFEGDENQLYDHFFHKPKDPNKDLDITYNNLLWDFNTAFGKKYNINIDVLDTIRILRNGLVHSGSDEIINLSSKFIEEVLKYAEENDITVHYFLSQKVSINAGASINFSTIINKDSNKFDEYRNIATAKKPIQKFNKSVRLKILKEQKPFDAIIIDLKKWITAIRNELANVK